jgi:hypothetical protein
LNTILGVNLKKLSFLICFLISFSLFGVDLKIEKDPVFKSILEEFEKPGQNTLLYKESENYRLDLSLYDLIDKVSIVTDQTRFVKYKKEINDIAKKDLIYFQDWFKKVKKIAQIDEEFYKKINKKLYMQLYSRNGVALLPSYKYIDFKRLKDLGLLRRITKYNEVASSPEGAGLLAAFEKVGNENFVTKKLTVSKFKVLKNKTIRKIKSTYLKVYRSLLKNQNSLDNLSDNPFNPVVFKQSKSNTIKAVSQGDPDSPKRSFINGIKIFNMTQGISHKHDVLNYVAKSLKQDGIDVPKQMGHLLLTPVFIEKNWKKVNNALKEYTLEKFVSIDQDEYSFQVRKWTKDNIDLIEKDLKSYNENNKSLLVFKYENRKRLPSRVDLVNQHDTLTALYPSKPWLKYQGPDFINRKGKGKYFQKRGLGKRIGNGLRKLIKVENYTSLIAGTATLILSGGNYSMALSTKNLVKKAVYTKKHDRDWVEFLKAAPREVLGGLILGAGFSAGRLYKILALGSAQGALQSMFTGQDIKTGALVGTGMKLIDYYVLPYALAKPMTSGYDSASLKMNRKLEILEKTIKRSLQGSIVAALTGESILGGAAKGGTYGFLSANISIWILGTRYNAFKDYDPAEVDEFIAAENAFQNDVGRGHFQIDRQLIMDTNYRVGGAWASAVSASVTLPGSVIMSDGGFARLSTLTHEAHHLMQQHQSGVFGFYLLRYLPTFFSTGYHGHPDENFLKHFIDQYL